MLTRQLGLVLAGLLAVATPALAQDPAPDEPEAWHVRVGGGVIVTPEFAGARDHRTRVLPYASLSYGDTVSASVEGGLSATLLRRGDFTFGPLARFRFGQEEEDSEGLQGLGDVDASLEVGAFLGWRRGPFSARLSAGQDVIGGHRGATAEVSAAVTAPLARTTSGPVLLSVGPSLTFVSSKVNRAYFGVDALQSVASGLPVYDPSGGLQQAGIRATAIFPLGRRLSVAGFAGYDRILGDAADSPRVRVRGTPDQVSGGLFVSYQLF